MVTGEIGPGSGYQSDQLGEKLQRLEDEVGGAVSEGRGTTTREVVTDKLRSYSITSRNYLLSWSFLSSALNR